MPSLLNFGQFALLAISLLPVREKTRTNYFSVYKCHIQKHLEDMDITKIKRTDIQNLLLGLPPQTAAMTLALVKTIFREALSQELVEYSPAQGVKGPGKIVPRKAFMTWDQLNSHHYGKYDAQIRFLALHGLRWSEAMALQPDDFRDGRVYINKSIHGPTKSQTGIRSVPHVSEFKILPATPKALRLKLEPYGVGIHSLRHTYAYILKSQGVHVTTAQKLLGHSDPRVTMAVYTAVLDSEIDDVGMLLKDLTRK
jgi:integrase